MFFKLQISFYTLKAFRTSQELVITENIESVSEDFISRWSSKISLNLGNETKLKDVINDNVEELLRPVMVKVIVKISSSMGEGGGN